MLAVRSSLLQLMFCCRDDDYVDDGCCCCKRNIVCVFFLFFVYTCASNLYQAQTKNGLECRMNMVGTTTQFVFCFLFTCSNVYARARFRAEQQRSLHSKMETCRKIERRLHAMSSFKLGDTPLNNSMHRSAIWARAHFKMQNAHCSRTFTRPSHRHSRARVAPLPSLSFISTAHIPLLLCIPLAITFHAICVLCKQCKKI